MSARIRVTAAVLGLFTLIVPAAVAQDQRTVNGAIQRGVAALKAQQTKMGYWKQSEPESELPKGEMDQRRVGVTALAGLALLEAGVEPRDPVLDRATDFIRDAAPVLTKTYPISLALMYFDRLGDPDDVPLIESLSVRLLAGQTMGGGWGYDCPAISIAEVHRLGQKRRSPRSAEGSAEGTERKRTLRDLPPEIREQLNYIANRQVPPPASIEDNSNTQFATMALWVARRHGLPTDDALKRLATRFRDTQNPDGGWDYKGGPKRDPLPSSASITCAGLLGMAIAYGLVFEKADENPGGKMRSFKDINQDNTIRSGLLFLGDTFEPLMSKVFTPGVPLSQAGAGKSPLLAPVQPSAGGAENPAPGFSPFVPGKGTIVVNKSIAYFLWSMERVAMVFGLDTIGKKDWFAMGAHYLIANQEKDGSWRLDEYRGVVDTSFAILFLTRSNLAKDLTARLRKRMRDPGELVLKATDVASARNRGKAMPPLEEKPDPQPRLNMNFPPATESSSPKLGAGSTLSQPGAGDSEATRLRDELTNAAPDKQEALLEKLRESKGASNTEALALAIPQLKGSMKVKARDALAERLARMTATTLRAKLQADNAEIRRAAALACATKEDTRLAADLIPLLEDTQSSVARAAETALKTLTGQDLGPSPGKWKDWLAGKSGGAKPKAAARDADKESLQGTWALDSSEVAGRPVTKVQLNALRIKFIFDGDKLTIQNRSGSQKARFDLDSAKSPKTIDLMTGSDVKRGIYELEGDTFTLCWVPDGEQRPRGMNARPGTRETLYVFKRQ